MVWYWEQVLPIRLTRTCSGCLEELNWEILTKIPNWIIKDFVQINLEHLSARYYFVPLYNVLHRLQTADISFYFAYRIFIWRSSTNQWSREQRTRSLLHQCDRFLLVAMPLSWNFINLPTRVTQNVWYFFVGLEKIGLTCRTMCFVLVIKVIENIEQRDCIPSHLNDWRHWWCWQSTESQLFHWSS
jgi:hypothetical protein